MSQLARAYHLWVRFARLLEWVVSLVVLAAVFTLVVTPTGLAMKLLRSDPLRLRLDPNARSYWLERSPGDDSRERFRRQF